MADNVGTKLRWGIAPYFIVDDVVTTANYYRDQLGFHYERFWNEPPSFCMVKRGGIVIMLAQLEAPGAMRPNHIVDPEGSAWDAYIWIENADALYAEFKSKGVKIARDTCDQPYGCRDSTWKTATAIAYVLDKTSKGARNEIRSVPPAVAGGSCNILCLLTPSLTVGLPPRSFTQKDDLQLKPAKSS